MSTLLVISDTKNGFSGRAEELLSQDHRVIASPADTGDRGLAAAIDAIGAEPISILTRGEGASRSLRLVAGGAVNVAAVVLEAPPDLADDAALAAILPTITIPVLLIYGTRDETTPAELGRRYRALLRNAWFVMVYAAGHDIAADRPEAYADLVGDFLRRGPRFAVSDRGTKINP